MKKMSKVKRFFLMIPELCGFKNVEQCREILELAYEDELKNKKSIFRNMKKYRDNGNRFDGLYSFICEENDRLDYCITLLHIIEYKKYSAKDKKYNIMLEQYIREAEDKEKYYPDIEKYMSVEEASQDDPFWF